ncbi:MAG: 7-carboxy-7-deazaguanine synthase QueE [Planctomycetaceae bacterium]
MQITELFHSVQGEGKYAGTPSVFVRTTGCNLRCWFCDTPYTSWEPEGSRRSWESVRDQVLAYDCEHVVITGGEPLLQAEVGPLTRTLHDAGRFITIETAGTVLLPVYADLMSISPKRPNSTPWERDKEWALRHEATRDNLDTLRSLTAEYPYQLKYVVDQPEDIADVDAHIATISGIEPDRVYLMPQGVVAEELATRMTWIKAAAAERNYRVSPRLHIELFGNVRGT